MILKRHAPQVRRAFHPPTRTAPHASNCQDQTRTVSDVCDAALVDSSASTTSSASRFPGTSPWQIVATLVAPVAGHIVSSCSIPSPLRDGLTFLVWALSVRRPRSASLSVLLLLLPYIGSFVAAAWLAATASAHGNVTSPPARLPGPGMVQACGQPAVDAVLQDGTLPLEDVLDVLPSCTWSRRRTLPHLAPLFTSFSRMRS
ncbi:hypothetical protein VTK73DRAFT_5227 [Phialemonium thermophilum]|uniref:Uncharacterized protein n=1 Tax=Phialemonium thermophilum TaxID=223376 RepID=A0ABR3V2L5_9PEZI